MIRYLLIIGSIIGLLLTILPAFLFFNGVFDWQTHVQLMFTGMVLWFITAPFWINPKEPDEV